MGSAPAARGSTAKAATALELVKPGLSPTAAARQVGLGRATVYREMAPAGVGRPA